MFAVGLLYSVQEFLAFVHANRVAAAEMRASFREFGLVRLSDILDVAQFAGWAGVDVEGRLTITDSGLEIICAHTEIERLRIQLTQLILKARPPWSNLFPRGREEAIPYLPAPVQQCLREAALTSGETTEIIRWWDNLSDAARSDERSKLTAVGREGEALSMNYEQARIGIRPEWKSLYSNNAGYDLLSRVADAESDPLRIEVKCSKQSPSEARFFVTINEWYTALSATHYVFHLWLLSRWTEPRIVSTTEMKRHMPRDHGSGEWQLVVVPFSALI